MALEETELPHDVRDPLQPDRVDAKRVIAQRHQRGGELVDMPFARPPMMASLNAGV